VPSSHTIVGIDIGTSKVVVTVAEPNPTGVPRVVGAGMARTRGMRAGAIVSFDEVAQAVAAAVSQAETTSGRQITSAWVTFSGNHVACENASGGTTLTNHPHEIHEILDPDIQKALAAARPSPAEIGREVVLVVPRTFTVDGVSGITDPIGITGHRLDAQTHVVTASTSQIHNLVRAVPQTIDVRELVTQGLASGESVATPDERGLGCVVIDIGAGTTDISVFIEGAIWHTAVLPFGGQNCTNDIAYVLRTPVVEAEALKVNHAHAIPAEADGEPSIEVSLHNRSRDTVSARYVSEIVSARIVDIFERVREELGRSGLSGALSAGAILTGGTSTLPGIETLAETVLAMPARVGIPGAANNLGESFRSPAFAAAVGVVAYGCRVELATAPVPARSSTVGGLLDAVRRLFLGSGQADTRSVTR
jgi:cell division protein FtsA